MNKYLVRLPGGEQITVEADYVSDEHSSSLSMSIELTSEMWQVIFHAAPGGWLSYELVDKVVKYEIVT